MELYLTAVLTVQALVEGLCNGHVVQNSSVMECRGFGT